MSMLELISDVKVASLNPPCFHRVGDESAFPAEAQATQVNSPNAMVAPPTEEPFLRSIIRKFVRLIDQLYQPNV